MAFWKPKDGEARLSDQNRDGLATLCAIGLVDTYLGCYKTPENCPPMVYTMNSCMSESEFERLATINENHRAVVCDLARFRDIKEA